MPTYEIRRIADGAACLTAAHPSCLPDGEELASLYAAGYVLLENGRKTTAARRKELLALRAKELKGE